MSRLASVVMIAIAAALLSACDGPSTDRPPAQSIARDNLWSGMGPQARCDSAASLVTAPDRWHMVCRWRNAGEGLQGQAFPPPKGPPPFEDPHIEIYVAPDQSREELANAIAHELGHMRHTREPTFVDRWLSARNLPPDTASEVWTEDYAEVFAALFSPPADHWRAPTPRPSADALLALKGSFFS